MPGSGVSGCGEPAMSERNEVRSEVADTDTGERAAISGSKLAFYGNVIPTCNRRIPVKRFSGRLVMFKGIYR